MKQHSFPNVIKGLGTDIIEIDRIRLVIQRHKERFIMRLLTENERAYCAKYRDQVPRIAGRFAAKEAIFKAFGTGLKGDISWQDIEVMNDVEGKPEVKLSERLQNSFLGTTLLVSISHCKLYATATAILAGETHVTP